ncbi:MAG: hypothetical protein MUC88_11430 [Planctomycetes bacterium]|jgi:hypothetical protein|nr:hypothetical protein [Planctomycetota bacterium]
MFRNAICVATLVAVLGLAGNVSADVVFTDTTGDHLWSTPANWATGAVPTLSDGYARLFTIPGPIVKAKDAFVVSGIHLGNDNGAQAGALTVQGGTLEVETVNCGYKGTGTINISDGTLRVTGTLKIGRDPTAIGHINLTGGTISAGTFLMREKQGAVGTMDVGSGVLRINGDRVALVQGYIKNGWITAYGGNGTLNLEYNVANPGQTTLTAIHKLNPNPANRAIAAPGAVKLSWTLPDPCVPGQPVLVDVYFTDSFDALLNFTDPDAIRIVNKKNVASVVVQTQTKKQYFWAVDTYVGSAKDPILGPIFSFTADNAPPLVNAGPDINTFLQEGPRTGPISGTVTDDGAIRPFTVTWTVVQQPRDANPSLPGAVIADPTALQTTVTVAAVGNYVLQLEANDGEYTSSDTMTIYVHPDDWKKQ